MPETRYTGSQESIKEFLKSMEFKEIIKAAVKEETDSLLQNITELEEEIARQSSASKEQLLKTKEFESTMTEIIKKETEILTEKIKEVNKEVMILKDSNILLINLLTSNSKVTDTERKDGQEKLMIKKVHEITENDNLKTTITLCRKGDNKNGKTYEKKEDATKIKAPEDKDKQNYNWTTVTHKRGKETNNYETEMLNRNTTTDFVKKTNRSSQKPHSTGFTGSNPQTSNIKAVSKMAEIFISRLHPSTTSDQIKTYLGPEFPEIQCESIESKHPETYSSFKITINSNNFTHLMNPDKWPNGVFINKFFRKRKQFPTIETSKNI